MNRKISTMFASALLMVGAMFSNAQAQAPTPVSVTVDMEKSADLGKYYYVGLPATAGAGSTAYLMAEEVDNTNDGKSYTTIKGVATPADLLTNDAYLFKIEVVSDGAASPTKHFKLKSKLTDAYVQFSTGKTDATGLDATSLALVVGTEAKDMLYTDMFGYPTITAKKAEVTANTGMKFIPFHGGATANTNELKLETTPELTVNASGTALQFFAVPTTSVDAEFLNQGLNNGFSFEVKDVEDNIFGNQVVKAFEVETAFDVKVDGAEGRKVVAGTYFAISYPKELAGVNVITEDEEEAFRKCTFIAVDPVTNLVAKDKDVQKAGKNFGFTTIEGKDFNFYTLASTDPAFDKEKVSKGSQISIYNAVFKVETNKDNEDKYSISVENFRYKKEVAADKLEHGQTAIRVISKEIGDAQVLATTTGDPSYIFTFSEVPLAKPIDLLNDSTASVYNIRFVSGEKSDSEKGKYLGVGVKTGTSYSFLAQGSAIAQLNTPQYQFVISNVNEEDKTITFTNRETGEDFVCTLYTTATENEYVIASAVDVATGLTAQKFTVANLENDGSVDYAVTPMDLAGTTIQLIPATVDMYAGFANRGDNAGYTYITFAKDATPAAAKLYMSVVLAGSDYKLADAATGKESEATLFELVKSEKPVVSTRWNYAFDKDGVAAIKSKGDTVAYYTYAVKMIDPKVTEDYYLNEDPTANFDQEDDAADASQFVIKENKDGSVSIVIANSSKKYLAADTKSLKCDKTTAAIAADGTPYIVAATGDIKSYLLEEELGATLEPRGQNVALQSANGGYVSVSDLNEAVIAIKTAANEDLTFWLDTTDNEAILPSFYISHQMAAGSTDRLFMYYATDSAKYYTAGNIYQLEDQSTAKVMFKAAALVNPDTLVTTVNNKVVNVAEKADADGVLGGLNNFKFNIFKANDGSDNYVVRCKENNQYLSNKNGFLILAPTQADALKVAVESVSSPVANEAIEAASINVVAGYGQVTIEGAAGKKVTISNVLGQTIANTTITSDNASIAAPAGVVVVAVEGEAAVKAIVK